MLRLMTAAGPFLGRRLSVEAAVEKSAAATAAAAVVVRIIYKVEEVSG